MALAKPQRTVAVPLERASIMLVTDHSRSMLATDVEPDRLTAAKRAARTFIDEIPARVRVGVVAFSDEPDVVHAPSHGPRRPPDRDRPAGGRRRNRHRRGAAGRGRHDHPGPPERPARACCDRAALGRQDDDRARSGRSRADGPPVEDPHLHRQPRDAHRHGPESGLRPAARRRAGPRDPRSGSPMPRTGAPSRPRTIRSCRRSTRRSAPSSAPRRSTARSPPASRSSARSCCSAR